MNRKYAITKHVDVLVDVVVEAESKDEALQKARSASAEDVVLKHLELPRFCRSDVRVDYGTRGSRPRSFGRDHHRSTESRSPFTPGEYAVPLSRATKKGSS